LAEGSRPDTKEIADKVIKVLEADLVAAGFDLLDVRVFQGGGRYQVRVFVDRSDPAELDAGGVTMEQVAKASRTASMLLEEADLFINQYVIEVSSPGVRRPLRTVAHFEDVVGEKLDVRVKGFPRVRGVLTAIEGDELVIAPKPSEEEAEPDSVRVKIPWIVEANLDPEFDVQAIINADRREKKDEKRRLRQEKVSGKKKGRPKNRDK